MSKIGKLFLVFCVLFSQYSGVLEVLAEEVNNNSMDEKDNTLEKDDTSQDDNNTINLDVSDNLKNNNADDTNNTVIGDTDDNTNSTVADSEKENSLDAVGNVDDTIVTGNGETVNDEEKKDDKSISDTSSGENVDETTQGDEGENQVVEDTSSYDADMNDKFVYNGKFMDGILYLIGNEEEYTVLEIKNSFDDEVIINRDSEELLDEAVIDSSDEIIVSIEDNLVKYKVVIMGDDDSSNNVDNDDVESVINNLFENSEYYNEVVDVNFDNVIDNFDISKLHYGVNNKEKSNIVATPVLTPTLVSDKDNMDIGDVVKIKLSVSGLEIYSVNTIIGKIDFDDTIFNFSSFTSSNGKVYYNEETKTFIAVGEFKDGDTIDLELVANLATEEDYVTFNELKVFNDGIEFELDSDSISTVFVVTYENNKGGDVENVTTTTTSDSSTTNPVVNYVSSRVLSSDSYLLDLKIKGYEIKFDPYTYEYRIKVGNKVDSLNIEVVLNDSNATYVINGNENFKVGENVVTIVVTSEAGTTHTYTIVVDKEDVKKASVKEETTTTNNISRYIVIGLIILVIAGLVYLIFKDDSEDEESDK